MTFGLNTFLFESPFTSNSYHLIKKFRDWGFDSIEIAIEETFHVNPSSLKKALDDNGMVCGSTCTALGPERDFRGTARQQQNAMDYMKGLVDIMAEINSPVLIGPLYSSVGRAEATEDHEYERQWEAVVKNIKQLAEYASQRNLKLAIEPLNRYETDFINTCEQLMKLLDDVENEAAGILLDTYHMNIEEKNSEATIRLAGKRLYHFHACGCDRGTPGNDHINWNSIVHALNDINYDSSVVIESFTTDVKVIAKAASIWRDFEPSKEDIALNGLRFLKTMLTGVGGAVNSQ
jgi:D-psicose/D-tagatose/L-ribulose 3-epimerase